MSPRFNPQAEAQSPPIHYESRKGAVVSKAPGFKPPIGGASASSVGRCSSQAAWSRTPTHRSARRRTGYRAGYVPGRYKRGGQYAKGRIHPHRAQHDRDHPCQGDDEREKYSQDANRIQPETVYVWQLASGWERDRWRAASLSPPTLSAYPARSRRRRLSSRRPAGVGNPVMRSWSYHAPPNRLWNGRSP